MARFDFKSNKHNNNSEVNKLQLQKQGQEMYDDTFAKNAHIDVKDIERIPVAERPLLKMLALTVSRVVTWSSLRPGKEGAKRYFSNVSLVLTTIYESIECLPLDQRAFKFDTSEGWTYDNALREALQLLFDDSDFFAAWLDQDENCCYREAEKVLCVQLPPNALLAIKQHLDSLYDPTLEN